MTPTLSPQLFAIFSALVEDAFGLHYTAEDAPIFADKLAARASEAGFESLLDYYYFLRYDAAAANELQALADALVVGETYFFRELEPARAAVEQVLVPSVRERGRARLWSAACATGEEPLSLAMLLEEAGIGDRTEIIATDVSQRALTRAREGSYRSRSTRVLPPAAPPPPGWTPALEAIAARALTPVGTGVRAARSVVSSIDYRAVNLLDPSAIAALGKFDLVLCRNVLIYFSDQTVTQVLASLGGALGDHGRLLIGASESLLRFGTALRCEERGGAFLYARRDT